MTTTTSNPRLLTDHELGIIIAFHRELKGWTQETLAELAALSVRTIQRIEGGFGASNATRRALANGLDIADLDFFNKPMNIPTPEDLQRQKEEFERKYVKLKAHRLSTGKQLVDLAYEVSARLFTADAGHNEEVDLVVAELADLFSDFCDIKEDYSSVERLSMAREFQVKIDLLTSLGVGLCYGLRRTKVKWPSEDSRSLEVGIAYVLAKPINDLPDEMMVVRAIRVGL